MENEGTDQYAVASHTVYEKHCPFTEWELPYSAVEFRRAFDDGRHVSPFEFEIEL